METKSAACKVCLSRPVAAFASSVSEWFPTQGLDTRRKRRRTQEHESIVISARVGSMILCLILVVLPVSTCFTPIQSPVSKIRSSSTGKMLTSEKSSGRWPLGRRLYGTADGHHDEPDSSLFTANGLLRGADLILDNPHSKRREATQDHINPTSKCVSSNGLSESSQDNSEKTGSRRMLFATALFASGAALAAAPDEADALMMAKSVAYASSASSKLQWETTPVNKRTGVTVFDAEKAGFNVRFVTYLSRFLLVFDNDCQRWWYARASDLPRTGTAEQVNELRLQQFGAFSASVEVGLQEYRGRDGPEVLLRSLLSRYCPDLDQLQASRENSGLPRLNEDEVAKLQREINEARRQIALLFGFMDTNQPVDEITKLLAAIDNGSIYSIRIDDPGSGYAPGYGSPWVSFPPPEAGAQYEPATGRAILAPNGRILRIDLVNRGFGYSNKAPPTVTISPPATLRFGDAESNGITAQASAKVFRSGVNKGRLERIQLIEPGAGYTEREIIRIRIAPPELAGKDGGVTATAVAVLELQVVGIEIVNNGTGYAVEKPIPVLVAPPPLTARVNMNDPLMARIVSPDQGPIAATAIPSYQDLAKQVAGPQSSSDDQEDPSESAIGRVMFQAMAGGKGGGGGCVGRACYDRPVKATAFARAEKDSYSAFRNEDEILRPPNIETALNKRSAVSSVSAGAFSSAANPKSPPPRTISASSSSVDGQAGSVDLPGFRGGSDSSSSQLLFLLPAGVGLEYNSEKGIYQVAQDPSFAERTQGQLLEKSARSIDPYFGPRGRSPIEREMKLGIATYLRFVASGAICSSGVHLALTPIDVVKTKVQTDPRRYPGVVKAFNRVVKEEGADGFFTGWAPTFLGFFVWGGFSYGFTEFLRRSFTELAGSNAASLEVAIILSAAGVASFFGSFILCPFEAVRIRSVAQPDFGATIVDVFQRMVKEEGFLSLFSAVPAFLLKEIPFAMAKFTVFDLSTEYMYQLFPAAREDIQLSLLVSLAGGTLGGFVAAVVSNPADVTISEMKKTKTEMGPREAAQIVLDRGGLPALFTGLPLRLVFYALIVSLQFLVYDAVRIALGIGVDDLKLYLDVLGGALSETGGPV